MPMQTYIYPRPDNAFHFESLCLQVFGAYLKLQHLQKFARSGQRQRGVDLLSIAPDARITGIQCKLRNSSAGLTLADFDAAVLEAKEFQPPLADFILATTAERDPRLQLRALELTISHR